MRVLGPLREYFPGLELWNIDDLGMSCLISKRDSITSERRQHFMNKEVLGVLFTLLHTFHERVPSLEVLIIHIANLLSMIMFNYERVPAWFHPVDMEEGFV